jgi:2-dehydropantoate 2-reductase
MICCGVIFRLPSRIPGGRSETRKAKLKVKMGKNPTFTPVSSPIRFLIFGAGAVGAYIGGSLILGGQQVVFLEKPEACRRLKQTGLLLNLYGQEYAIRQPVVFDSLDQALERGPYDAGIFALKSFDTRPALADILPYREQMPPVLCLQNGVENETLIAAALGAERVIAGTLTSAVSRPESNRIALERLRGVGIADTHPLSKSLVEAFNTASLNARLYPSAPAMKWSKLLTNLLANASSAILAMTPGEIFAHPGLYRLEIAQLRETLRVIKALQLNLVDLPATPVRALGAAVQNLPLWLSRQFLMRTVGSARGGKMPSLYIDLHSGRKESEVEFLNGAVVRQAQKLGFSAPANRLLGETLSAIVRGEISGERFARQPDQLLALWRK